MGEKRAEIRTGESMGAMIGSARSKQHNIGAGWTTDLAPVAEVFSRPDAKRDA